MVEGPAFKQEVPEIKDFVRVKDDEFIVKNGNATFTENVLFVDDNFFSVSFFSAYLWKCKIGFVSIEFHCTYQRNSD